MSAEPAREISQRELRNDSGRILRDVAAGATYTVTNNGTPVAELRPIAGPERFVSRQRVVEVFADAPDFGLTIEELRALHDKVTDDTLRDPWTGDPIT